MNRTRRTAPLVAALAALTLSLAACGEQDADPGAPTETTPTRTSEPTSEDPATEDTTMTSDKPEATELPSPTAPDGALPTGPVDPAVEARADVQAAIAAEAERAEVEPEAVTVAGYADVTWTDGSLGCPQPGMMYTQALVPGHQLVLEVDGTLASYHAAEGKPFRYCENPVPPAPGSGGTLGSR